MALSPDFTPGKPPPLADIAVDAWNLMGGLEWSAMDYICERFGIEDVDAFVAQLVAIRDHQEQQTRSQ